MDEHAWLAERFEEHRSRLRAVAYRMLGSLAEVDEAVQDSLIWEGSMGKTLGLIGVPSSMGAFAPGQEKGPRALRDVDLIGRLSRAGVEVADHGDGVTTRRWRPDKSNRRAQNLAAV